MSLLHLPGMTSVAKQIREIEYGNLLLLATDYLRTMLGLNVLRVRGNAFEINTVQRFLAAVWTIFYVVSFTLSNTVDSTSALPLKNSFVATTLPSIFIILLVLNTIFVFLFTHAFANDRKEIYETIARLQGEYVSGGLKVHSKGTYFVCILCFIRILHSAYWHVIVNRSGHLTIFYIVSMIFPIVVGGASLVEYVFNITILMQQFSTMNAILQEMRKCSLKYMRYPADERRFLKKIMDISDCHKELSKLGEKINKMYSLQLLSNIGGIYIFIVANSYVFLYFTLSTIKTSMEAHLVIMAFANVLINATCLLVVVELTTQLYKEVSENRCLIRLQYFYYSLRIQN